MTIIWDISEHPVNYQDALNIMEQNVAEIISEQSNDKVWLLEHPDIYTAGTSAKDQDLLDNDKFPIYKTGRGGQYTYHGPGIRIAYIMMNLKNHKCDVKKYICNLEQWIINTLKKFNINSSRKKGRVGIWIDNPDGTEDKIAAIGVRIRKWVSFHGIAININPNLDNFNGIIPCGISEKKYGVTSMHKLGCKISYKELDKVLQQEFDKIFS